MRNRRITMQGVACTTVMTMHKSQYNLSNGKGYAQGLGKGGYTGGTVYAQGLGKCVHVCVGGGGGAGGVVGGGGGGGGGGTTRAELL